MEAKRERSPGEDMGGALVATKRARPGHDSLALTTTQAQGRPVSREEDTHIHA